MNDELLEALRGLRQHGICVTEEMVLGMIGKHGESLSKSFVFNRFHRFLFQVAL
jgi:hypothetical protein